MSYIITLLQPIWQWLLSFGIMQVVAAIKHYIEEKAIKADRDEQAKKALDEYAKAANSPELTPEQKAKEQEDAFKKLSDTLRNMP